MLSWSCLSSHFAPLLEVPELYVMPGLLGGSGQAPDLCEPWARLLDGADALSQVAGRSDEMSLTIGVWGRG